MAIHVDSHWETICVLPNGLPVRSARVFNDTRVIGRVVDIAGQGFRADFVNDIGAVVEIPMPDLYTAIAHIADAAEERFKRLH